MNSFVRKLAVVTGGGSGIGRELVCQLATRGCSVATCDWNAETVAETAALAKNGAAEDVLVSSHICDVADAAQVQGFRTSCSSATPLVMSTWCSATPASAEAPAS